MGTTAPHEDSGTAPEPAQTRIAILAAARQVAARDGVLEMSLSSVAQQAGCAPTALYALFSSKDDMLLAVIADDLATLARAMRCNPSSLQVDHHEDSGQHSAAADNHTEPSHMDDSASDKQISAVSRFPVVQARRDRSQEFADTADAIAKLQDSVSRLEARPVDAWLERRLREFERALGVLQDHQAQRGGAETGFDDRVRELQQSIRESEERQKSAAEDAVRCLMQRLEASEKRLLELVSNMEADGSQLARRLTAVENATSADIAPLPLSNVPVEPPETEMPSTEEPTPEPAAQASMLSDGASYLAAARRSAQAAAVARERAAERKPKRKSNSTMLYLAAGSLFLFVVLLVAASLFLRDNAMSAASAPRPVHVVAVTHRTITRTALLAPDQRQVRLRRLAEAGNPAAELLVGLEYSDGSGLPKNTSTALEWLTRAAAKGQPVAEYSLGAMWEDGDGVHADPVQAFQWFGSAALRGNRKAMHSLAVAYAQGLGTTKNLTEAARWFERAATLGSVNSQFDLAVLYERGMGVPQSLATAYKWYAIAAAQGDRESQARVTALASTLVPSDLESARVAVVSFRPEAMDESANVAPKLSALP